MVDVIKMSFFGNSNIGVYAYANDKVVIIPVGIPRDDVRELSSVLKAVPIEMKTAGTLLNGVFIVGNNNGILLPRIVYSEELDHLQKTIRESGVDIVTQVLESKYTALGNLIACNSKGCIASPLLENHTIKVISDFLGVEVIKARIAYVDVPGSVLVITDGGGVVHPDASDDDIRLVKSVVKVSVERTTVNAGIPFVKSGLISNNKGVIVGGNTTGPELLRIKAGFEAGGGVE